MNNSTTSYKFTENQIRIIYTLNILEFLIHCAEIPVSIVNFLIIFKTSLIHRNLKIILLAQSVCIMQRGLGRTIGISLKFIVGNIFWEIHSTLFNGAIFFFITFRNFLIHVLVLERVLATVLVNRYETDTMNYFTFSWIIALTLVSFYNVSPVSSQLYFNNIVTLMTCYFTLALSLAEIFIFLFLRHHNVNKFVLKPNVGVQTLTERYQLYENVRTCKQLIPTFLLHFFNILLGNIAQTVPYYELINDRFLMTALGSAVFMLVSLNNLMIEITIITFHPVLYQKIAQRIRYALNLKNNKVLEAQQPNLVHLKTLISGRALINSNNTEREQKEHFEQLKMAWNV